MQKRLFLPELREESVIEEMSPGGPVVAGFADAEVLVFDSVLVERIPEALDPHIEKALLFRAALADEQVIHLVIGLRVVEEFTQGLLGRVVAGAEDAEIGEEVQGLQPNAHLVTAAHRKTGNRASMRIGDGFVVTVDEGDDGLAILAFHDVEREVGVPGMIAVDDLIVHQGDQHGFRFPFREQIVHDEVHASVIHPV